VLLTGKSTTFDDHRGIGNEKIEEDRRGLKRRSKRIKRIEEDRRMVNQHEPPLDQFDLCMSRVQV
jgi:hypothetical protein